MEHLGRHKAKPYYHAPASYSSERGERVLKNIKEFFTGHKFEPADYALYKGLRMQWFDLNRVEGELVTLSCFKAFCNRQGQTSTAESQKLVFDLMDPARTGHISFESFCEFNGLRLTQHMKDKIAECEARDPHPAARRAKLTDGHGHVVRPPKFSSDRPPKFSSQRWGVRQANQGGSLKHTRPTAGFDSLNRKEGGHLVTHRRLSLSQVDFEGSGHENDPRG
mmetsp:Transcript_48902/g.122205  ORF Transcript_48902/g.122205 Transcript_48902/m.122205 type:complete len:222 (-) Transcript_48902:282-947(-)